MADTSVEPFGVPEDGNDEQDDESEEDASEHSVLLDLDDNFNAEEFKVPKGPFMPQSDVDLEGLSETQVRKILEGISDAEIEDLFNKNTESFRCLAQALISRSSLMRHILYHFPVLEDPGIDEAFSFVEPEPTFDNIGAGKYRQLCKDMNIAPISRVMRSLNTESLNLKYYGLSDKQFKAISSCVMLNTYIKTLILEDNWVSPEAALWLCEMLRENNSIKVLNLRECRLGPQGMLNCAEGFGLNQSVREIDLSYNDLGDEGIETLVGALKDNFNVDKLNLGHNNLGEISGKLLGELLKEHANIDYLDLSWNNLYDGKALAYLCDGMSESDSLEYLNLSWNGIGTPESLGPVAKYLKDSQKLKHLDLSFNRLAVTVTSMMWVAYIQLLLCLNVLRLMGKLILMLTAALKENMSLTSINLGFNLITPTDAIKLISVMNPEQPLDYMDLQNVFVNKNFLPIWKKLTDMGKSVRIEGVLENYSIQGPDIKKVIFDRCRYLAVKPKKKKLRKDFGSDFIWNLPDEIIDNATLKKYVKKSKIKLDSDLIDILGDTFSRKKKKIELKLMRDEYLERYPHTQPPAPTKTKKDKKGKKNKKKVNIAPESPRPSTEEKAIGTDSLQMSASSLVTSKMVSGTNALIRLSKIQKEHHENEPTEPEQMMSSVNFDDVDRDPKRSGVTIKSILSMKEAVSSAPSVMRLKMARSNKSKVVWNDEELPEAEIDEEDTKPIKRPGRSIVFKESVDVTEVD